MLFLQKTSLVQPKTIEQSQISITSKPPKSITPSEMAISESVQPHLPNSTLGNGLADCDLKNKTNINEDWDMDEMGINQEQKINGKLFKTSIWRCL